MYTVHNVIDELLARRKEFLIFNLVSEINIKKKHRELK